MSTANALQYAPLTSLQVSMSTWVSGPSAPSALGLGASVQTLYACAARPDHAARRLLCLHHAISVVCRVYDRVAGIITIGTNAFTNLTGLQTLYAMHSALN